MGRIRNRIIPFKVINGDINKEDFEGYDVMQYLVNSYKKVRRRKKCPKTYDEFKRWVDRELAYMFWARCQYEIVLTKADKFIEQQALIKRYDELSEEQKKMFGETQDLLELYKSDSYNNLMCEQRETISKFYSNQQKIDVYYQLTQNSDIVMLVFLYNIGKLDLVEKLNLDSFKIMVKDDTNENVIKWFNIFEDLYLIDKNLNKSEIKSFLLNHYKDYSSGLTILSWPCYDTLGDLTILHQIELNINIIVELITYKLKNINNE